MLKYIRESQRLVKIIVDENPIISEIFSDSKNVDEAVGRIRQHVLLYLQSRPDAYAYYKYEQHGGEALAKLSWKDYAAIRLLDYADYEGKRYYDENLSGSMAQTIPYTHLFDAIKENFIQAQPAFFMDMLNLFRQYNGTLKQNIPSKEQVEAWMFKHPTGLGNSVIRMREENKDHIIRKFIEKMDKGEITPKGHYRFEEGMGLEAKYSAMLSWWEEYRFHTAFAIRDPKTLNEFLNDSIPDETMDILLEAQEKKIPLFVNPYYLSLVLTNRSKEYQFADQTILDYIFVSKELVEEFGYIKAWEKEDLVEPGKPNVAGWLLPDTESIHRRYPDVAIFIPSTPGRACGGLCVSCQRMYGFQSGVFDFDLEKFKPKEVWKKRLPKLLDYFEQDAQLRDILITGGDALMSTNKQLTEILDAVYDMALSKIKANEERDDGEKYAQIQRVRLGSRLPVYIPQRLNDDGLIKILKDFKTKASKIGIQQFVLQTHFESAMEITPDVKLGIKRILEEAEWIVTNQLVFIPASARRGHNAKLRQELNNIGVLPYYTFSTKGFMENVHNFSNNARNAQEITEEKVIGKIDPRDYEQLKSFTVDVKEMQHNIDALRQKMNSPFLATDRSVLNLPGVGKSLTYRTIGITSYGRRILSFDHDHTRMHSPIVQKMGRVVLPESRSILELLEQLQSYGEQIEEYESIWGYSIFETESRMPIYEYPEYDYEATKAYTNYLEE